MNCDEIERKILLSGSCELSVSDEKKLNEHLAGCEKCRAYKQSSMLILEAARRNMPVSEPSALVVARILSAAEAARGRGRILLFPYPALQMLASVAALVLVLAGGTLMFRDDGRTERINQLSAIISVVSEVQDEVKTEDSLYELAEQLLILQGFKEVNSTEYEDQDVEQFPTVLQSRNTSAHFLRKCV